MIYKLRPNLFLLVTVLLAVVVAAQLIVSSALAGKGSELVRLEEEARRLERENSKLKQEFAEKSSLSKIAQVAKELGFTKPSSFVYINLSEPVASLDSTATAQ